MSILEPGPRPIWTAEQEERRRRESQQNFAYLNEHEEELFAEHPGAFILVHSGDQAEAFYDPLKMLDRLDELDPISRGAARHRIQRKGIWIL